MKPPPRKRAKVDRTVGADAASRHLSKWQQPEKRKLLKALSTLHKSSGANADVDYAYLNKCIATRSVSEIQSVVESLKDKVVSGAMFELNKWKSERKLRKPIEIWTDMAFSVTGNLEEHISTAFSQMLMVSSTEPLTLRNCDPPQIPGPPTDHPVGRTVPLRPLPRVSVQARPMNSRASPVNRQSPKSVRRVAPAAPPGSQPAAHPPAPEKSPPPPSGTAATTRRATAPAAQQPPHHCQTAAAPSVPWKPSSPSPDAATPPAAGAVPVSGVAQSPGAANSRLSPSAAEAHAWFGRTSKYATKDSARTLGVKCVVDFEKIYCYLSSVHKPGQECNLTPMESAIVLDLLMSLPEELVLLDCNKLHEHLIQVYKCLSSPAISSGANETLGKLRCASARPTEAASTSGGNQTAGEQNAATAADVGDVAGHGGQEPQRNELHQKRSTPEQSGTTDTTGFSPPPLNPFMIPLDMLRRK